MKNINQNLEYNRLQQLVLWAIVLLFLLFITLLVPDNAVIKLLIFLVGIPLVGLVVILTSTNLSLLYNFSAWKSIICTAIIFIVVPTIMTAIYYSHNNRYLSSAPTSNQVSLRITADVKRTGGVGSVGNEWSYKHEINNTTFKTGEIVEINSNKPFTITSTITEHDDISDIGRTTSNEHSLGKSGDYSKEISLSNTVKVMESGGRKNSGSYAIFSVKYTINRVIPSDYTFFDIYFFTNNENESIFLWIVLLLGLGCIAFVVFVIYSGKKQESQLEAEKKAEEEAKVLREGRSKKKICAFLWTYYGYPPASYEGRDVEVVRYNCGKLLARRDNVSPDLVSGIPDSGIAHAVGYANESGIPYARPFVKYTPTWPRSFMPPHQSKRNLIAKMKLIPVHELIHDKKLLLIDDSIVRGTQLRETTEFLYEQGAKEVHIRVGCPPLIFGCKYLSFSRSSSEMELITRRVIAKLEGKAPDRETLKQYVDPEGEKYQQMLEMIRKELHFTSLRYHRIDDMVEAIGLPPEDICTYCWSGEE